MLIHSKVASHFKLSPYDLNHNMIFQLIQSSNDIDIQTIPSISIHYIMHTRHIHPDYGCLIFDYQGYIYRSEWSSTRIMQMIHQNQYGYDYALWSDFLQSTFNKPRTVFPFVNGNHIYLRLKRDKAKHSDWVNLTRLNKWQFTKPDESDLHSQQQAVVELAFSVEEGEVMDYQSLSLQFIGNPKRIISQINYAYQITSDWHSYLSQQTKTQSVRLYMNNPAFRHIIHNGLARQFRLVSKVKIQLFLEYVHATQQLKVDRPSSFDEFIESKQLLHYVKEKAMNYSKKLT